MTISNQCPRLRWTAEPEAVSKPSYIARPHSAGWARVYLHRINVDGEWWSWTAHWPERFIEGGMLQHKQAAADAATIAYWDAMEATARWTLLRRLQRPT